MITKKLHIIIFLLISFIGFSQEKLIKGYKIDGDNIVFTFDKRDYEIGTNDRNQEQLDFNEFDIKNVAVSGNFNNWSRKKWKMIKVDENIYQLKKKITDFNDDFNWEFKFIVNNSFWAEPSENIENITPAETWHGTRLNAYNLRIIPITISKNGNAKFFLKGYKNANKVILSGSFNKCNEHLYKMIKTKDGWTFTTKLTGGKHHYKFIVDGNWELDPNNSVKEYDNKGNINSVKMVK